MRNPLFPAAAVLLSACLLAPAACQAPGPPPANLEAMKLLEWMVGEWDGPATIQTPQGQSVILRQHERVEKRLMGLLLTVEGTGRMRAPGEESDRVVFNAFGTLSYDGAGKKYRFLAHTHTGLFEDAETQVSKDRVIWSIRDRGQGGVRYTITHTTQDEWHEIGERSLNGEWKKFFEMKLTRRKTAL